jgi:hypothetical protein
LTITSAASNGIATANAITEIFADASGAPAEISGWTMTIAIPIKPP